MGVRRPGLRVHIDRLVLDGFTGLGSAAVEAAVRDELARRFTGEPVEDAVPVRRRTVDGGEFDLRPETGADTVGRQVARRLHATVRAATSAAARGAGKGGRP